MTHDMLVSQKYLKKGGLITFITVLTMTPMFSVDMYLPALPQMNVYFAVSGSIMNLTLVGFYIFLALGILFFGPLSDKHGRKPILIISLVLFMIFSGLCAVSVNICHLILFRAAQAFGAGGMTAISTALIKDSFYGKTRVNILAIVTSIAIIGPMVAPVAGVFLLQLYAWKAIFWGYAIIGILCLMATFLLLETLPASLRLDGNLLNTMKRLVIVGKNKNFSYFLIIVSLFAAPYLAYVAVSSYIFIDFFGVSETTYSLFYAINAVSSAIGPMIYIKINGKLAPKKITWLCFALAIVSGVSTVVLGNISPVFLLLSFTPFALAESIIRVFSTNILLGQQESDTGSASSLINFIQTIIGSIGMVFGALPWSNYITGIGICIMCFTIIGVIGWIALLKSNITIKGLLNDNKTANAIYIDKQEVQILKV